MIIPENLKAMTRLSLKPTFLNVGQTMLISPVLKPPVIEAKTSSPRLPKSLMGRMRDSVLRVSKQPWAKFMASSEPKVKPAEENIIKNEAKMISENRITKLISPLTVSNLPSGVQAAGLQSNPMEFEDSDRFQNDLHKAVEARSQNLCDSVKPSLREAQPSVTKTIKNTNKKKQGRPGHKPKLPNKTATQPTKPEQKTMISEITEQNKDNDEILGSPKDNLGLEGLLNLSLFGGEANEGTKVKGGAFELSTVTQKKKSVFINPMHPLQKSSNNQEPLGIEDDNDIDELIEEGYTNHIKSIFNMNKSSKANIFEELLNKEGAKRKGNKTEMSKELVLLENRKMERYFQNRFAFLNQKPWIEPTPSQKVAAEILQFNHYFNQELSDISQTNQERLQEAIKLHSAVYSGHFNRRRGPR